MQFVIFHIFFNNAEYSAQANIAITMVKSPLLNSKFLINLKSAFVIINITPVKDNITPKFENYLIFQFLILLI